NATRLSHPRARAARARPRTDAEMRRDGDARRGAMQSLHRAARRCAPGGAGGSSGGYRRPTRSDLGRGVASCAAASAVRKVLARDPPMLRLRAKHRSAVAVRQPVDTYRAEIAESFTR